MWSVISLRRKLGHRIMIHDKLFKALHDFRLHTNLGDSLFSITSILNSSWFLNLSSLKRYKAFPIVVLNSFYLMVRCTKHHLVCLLGIHIVPLVVSIQMFDIFN